MKGLPLRSGTQTEEPNREEHQLQADNPDQVGVFHLLSRSHLSLFNTENTRETLLYPESWVCTYFACHYRKDHKLSKTRNSSGASPQHKYATRNLWVTSSSVEISTENTLKVSRAFWWPAENQLQSSNPLQNNWAIWELFSDLLKNCSFAKYLRTETTNRNEFLTTGKKSPGFQLKGKDGACPNDKASAENTQCCFPFLRSRANKIFLYLCIKANILTLKLREVEFLTEVLPATHKTRSMCLKWKREQKAKDCTETEDIYSGIIIFSARKQSQQSKHRGCLLWKTTGRGAALWNSILKTAAFTVCLFFGTLQTENLLPLLFPLVTC